MSTPLSELLSLVAAHGKSQSAAFLQGEAVIAGSPDQEIWEHLARHDILWDGLTVAEQDQIRDQYLEAFKAEAARRLTPSDSDLAELLVDAFTMIGKPDSPIHQKLAQSHKEAMRMHSQLSGKDRQIELIREKLKDCESALERSEKAHAAPFPVPAPLVPEVVKAALEGLLKACEGHGTTAVEYSEWQDRMSKAVAHAEGVLQNYRPAAQEGSVCEVEPLGEVEENPRGFRFITFRDAYDEVCSVQESSADGKFLWLGQDKVTPKILASKAATVGVITDETTGWVEVPMSPDVMLSSRMHLHEVQVRSLVAHLQAWLATGSFDLKGLPSSPPSSEDKELLTEAREALEPFAHPDLCKKAPSMPAGDKSPVYGRNNATLLLGDFRRAATVLSKLTSASTTPQKGGQGV